MKKSKIIVALLLSLLVFAMISIPVFAANAEENSATAEAIETAAQEENTESDTASTKIIAAAALIGVVATAGAIAMGWAITSGSKSISRQPEAAGNIRTNVMLGLVFIETAIIYALIVTILVIFVM